MTLETTAFTGGFSNPVYDSQSVFHALMNAFAKPGSIAETAIDIAPPAPMQAAQGAVALCLTDHDTPVLLSDSMQGSVVSQWIAFHAGAPVTGLTHDARFAFFAEGDRVPDFADFAIGSQEYPDRSTTLVIEIASLEDGPTLTSRVRASRPKQPFRRRGCPMTFSSSGPSTARFSHVALMLS